MCSNIYNQTFWIFHFLCVFGFLHTQNQKHKSKIISKNNKNNAYKEMHNAQMHDNEAFNTWRVLQRSKELDQGSKEQKPNHRNPSSSKRNDCFWISVSWEVRRGLEEWEPEMNIDKEVRTLKSFFNNLPFSPKSGLTFISQLPKILSFSSFF